MKITKNFIANTVLWGVMLVPFIAFIVPNGMFFPFITGKGFTFRILVEILFGLYVILAFIDAEYRPKMSWLTKSVLLFTVAILVADLLGVSVYKSLWSNYERMEGFVLIAHLLMYYLLASSVLNTRVRWNQFFNISIAGSVIMSFYSLLQMAGKITINQGGVRVDATFGNASYLAIYLVLHIFLCLYMLLGEAKYSWQKWVYGSAAVLETIILYYTATRGAILGLVGGLLLAAILIIWKERENKTLRKISLWSLGVVAALILGFFALKNTTFVQTSPVLSRFAHIGKAELVSQGRYYVWPMAVKGIMERPIFGWGQENFNFVFNKYYDPRMYEQEQWFDRTHDLILDWLIAGGIVGFLAYASMYLALFYYVWRKESMLKMSEKSLLTGMIAAYVFHNIFVFDNLISYVFFFSILAYIHSLNSGRSTSSSKFYTKMFSTEANNYVVVPIVVVVTILTIYFVNVPPILANQTLIAAISPQPEGVQKNLDLFKKVYTYDSFGTSEATEQLLQITMQLSNSQVSNDLKQGFYDFAKEKIEEKIKSSPHDARYLVFAGSFFNHFGQNDEAIKYLNDALVESPKKQSILFELGTSYIGKNDLTKMFSLFKQAYDLEPDSLESQIIYAVGAIYTKNSTVFKEIASKFDPNIVVSDNRFLQAYAYIGDYSSVIKILNTRLVSDPNNEQYKLSLASAYASIGQKQKAISIIQEIINQDPTFKDQGEQYIKQIQSS